MENLRTARQRKSRTSVIVYIKRKDEKTLIVINAQSDWLEIIMIMRIAAAPRLYFSFYLPFSGFLKSPSR